jgi:hypothetical protein
MDGNPDEDRTEAGRSDDRTEAGRSDDRTEAGRSDDRTGVGRDDRADVRRTDVGDAAAPAGVGDADAETVEDGTRAADVEAEADRVRGYLVSFVRALRRRGVDVPATGSLAAARALAEVGLDDRRRARAALRAALVSRAGDADTFELLFPEFWRQLVGEEDPLRDAAPEQGQSTVAPPSRSMGAAVEGDADGGGESADARASVRTGVSRAAADEDAAVYPEETDEATASVYSPAGSPEPVTAPASVRTDADEFDRAIGRLTAALGNLRGRRWARSGDERLDSRRVLRRSLGTGGVVLSVPETERRRSAVRAVLLVDVSRSVLDTVDRDFLLRFLRRVRREWRDVRIFFFDTDLREVTDAFDAPSPEAAAQALERAEAEWGGGTRIGNALGTLRREHPDAVERDAVAFVVSDGLEVGEIDELESGMTWLSRRAGAVLWLNPLAASAEYEPTCRGMAASLPYVDGLFAFAGPGDVAELARQLDRQGVGGTIGYRYDPRRSER